MIRFDFSGVMKDVVGERGFSSSDLDALAPTCARALGHISKGRESGAIAFYDLPGQTEALARIQSLAGRLSGRFDNVVNLGIGGSALGPKTVFTALKDPFYNLTATPRMFFADNVDPEYMTSLLEFCDPERTLFIVTSKSGTTAEPAAQFMLVLDMLKKRLGAKWNEHLVFITDPARGVLRPLAEQEDIPCLDIPPAVGGRFSVLTPVGLFPAAMCGVDVAGIMAGAALMAERCLQPGLDVNPAHLYGAIHYLGMARGMNISVLMPYANALYDLADWYRQLWAESLGKRYSLDGREVFAGQTPVKALGATDQHSQVQLYMEGPFDKIVNILTVDDYRKDVTMPAEIMADVEAVSYLGGKSMSRLINAEARGTLAALVSNGRPATHISVDTIDAPTLGGLFMFFEAATAFAGYLLDIDPFDQPGVELGKLITFGLMGRPGYEDQAVTPASLKQMVFEV